MYLVRVTCIRKVVVEVAIVAEHLMAAMIDGLLKLGFADLECVANIEIVELEMSNGRV